MEAIDREAMSNVYDALTDYIYQYGYSPTRAELVTLSEMWERRVNRAVRSLLDCKFITYSPRKFRSIRIEHRYCKCGTELTPNNCQYEIGWNGKLYVKGKCTTCINAYNRHYRNENSELDKRRKKREYRARIQSLEE